MATGRVRAGTAYGVRGRSIGGAAVAAALLVVLAAGCGGASDGAGGDGSLHPFDAAILVPDLGGGRVDAGRPDQTAPDVPREDEGGPAAPDGDGPDAARPDVGWVDAGGGCGACPAERPLCVDGRCACTDGTCGAGTYCDHGTCAPCRVDLACGPQCEDCQHVGRRCAADGARCVECGPEVAEPCGDGQFCDDGGCAPCDVGAACGPTCQPCPADRPSCVGGACTCTPGACPEGSWCADGRCQPCVTPVACGPQCVDCLATAGAGLCREGVCGCINDDHCTADRWCDGGACVPCGAADPLHCGATCAVCAGATPVCVDGRCACATDADCGEAARCEAGGCVACADAAHCGADCAPCPPETPLCDGDRCVSCLSDGDCGAGSWCADGACQACGDDDPEHCGPSCLDCAGGAPTCSAGRCVCAAGSCPSGQACVDEACVPCDSAERCGPSCVACGVGAPFCAPDASGCVECLGDGDCVAPEVCGASGACIPPCSAEGCASDLARDAETCGAAITVGRLDATRTAFLSGDTYRDGNDDDLGTSRTACWDGKYDNFYRIWLVTGDRIDVVLDPQSPSFNSMLKLYTGTDCEGGANGDDDLVDCYNPGGNGGDDTFGYTAPADGWVTIVVDGRSAFDEEGDWGPYVLRVTLTCANEGCCCL